MGSIRQLSGNIDMELFHMGVSGELIWGESILVLFFFVSPLDSAGELCFQWQLSRVGSNTAAGDQLAPVVNVVTG